MIFLQWLSKLAHVLQQRNIPYQERINFIYKNLSTGQALPDTLPHPENCFFIVFLLFHLKNFSPYP